MKSKHSILIAIGYPAPFPGAGWRRIQYIVDCLSSQGYRVYILSSISPSKLSLMRYRAYRSAKILRVPSLLLNSTFISLLNTLVSFLYTYCIS